MSSQQPRQPHPDHIAELTRGIELPLPPLPDLLMTTLAEVVEAAWQDLLAQHPMPSRTWSEVEINAWIAIRLNALIQADPCLESMVASVIPTPGLPSHDGGHLEKSPDLVVLFKGKWPRHPVFGLPMECKLIDKPRRKTVDLYCHDGLARFVRGEYAWATREAFMLAYVRDGATIGNTLTPYLNTTRSADGSDPFQTQVLPQSDAPTTRERTCSRHERPFRYLVTRSPPGPIVLWHVWLQTASPPAFTGP